MDKILVVDDDTAILKVLKMRLEADGYTVTAVLSGEEALWKIKHQNFDLALLDYKLGSENGIDIMEKLNAVNPEMPVIILTAYGTINNAVEAMKKGAYSYLTKPFEDAELILQIKNCLEKSKLSQEVKNLRSMVSERFSYENIIGQGGKMEKVLELVGQAAATDSTVYIQGESGTGKELIAKTLHVTSSRQKGPFIAVNCAAIPETLFESELFGYEKGAFTGAAKSRKGLLTQAQEGTFFFDEISEIPQFMQAKLLRVLQENEYYPLGGNKCIKLDARIIVATNKDLAAEVEKGNFREDLYYRVHVIPIKLPPLRDRKESISILTEHFLIEFRTKMKKKVRRITPAGMNKLILYSWPGNVRELKNVIEYAVAMSTGTTIGEDLLLQTKEIPENDTLKPLKEAKMDFEREYLAQLLKLTMGNVSQAAKLSGKYRADFYDLMKKCKLNAMDFRAK